MTVHAVYGSWMDANMDAHLPGTTGDLTWDSFIAEGRDAAYSLNTMSYRAVDNGSNEIRFPNIPASTDYWMHWRAWNPDIRLSQGNGHIATWYAGTGQALARMDLSGDDIYAVVYGDTTVSNLVLVPMPANTTRTYDVRIQVTPSNITMTIYQNNVLLGSATASNTVGGKGGVEIIIFQNFDITNSLDNARMSEVIMTDAEDTRNWRVATLEADAAGFHTDWDGDHTQLSENSSRAAAAPNTTLDRVSSVVSTYGGAGAPTAIRGVFTNVRASKGASGLANLTQFLRVGGTDYDGTQVALTEEFDAYMEEWATNPDTAVDWVVADLTGLEFGLLAET